MSPTQKRQILQRLLESFESHEATIIRERQPISSGEYCQLTDHIRALRAAIEEPTPDELGKVIETLGRRVIALEKLAAKCESFFRADHLTEYDLYKELAAEIKIQES